MHLHRYRALIMHLYRVLVLKQHPTIHQADPRLRTFAGLNAFNSRGMPVQVHEEDEEKEVLPLFPRAAETGGRTDLSSTERWYLIIAPNNSTE